MPPKKRANPASEGESAKRPKVHNRTAKQSIIDAAGGYAVTSEPIESIEQRAEEVVTSTMEGFEGCSHAVRDMVVAKLASNPPPPLPNGTFFKLLFYSNSNIVIS